MKCGRFNLRVRVAHRPLRRVAPRRALVAVRCESASVDTLVRVKFTIPHHVEYGQSVCILGSAPELGEWQLDKCPCLNWGEGDVWTGVVELPPSTVEYKYFTKNEDGSPAEWQPCEKNLKAEILDGEEMEVNDEWNGELQETMVQQVVTEDAELSPTGEMTEAADVKTTNPPTTEASIPESVQEMAEEVVSDPDMAVKSTNASGKISV